MPKARWGRGPGVPPQTEKRGLYIKLMSQGMSNKAACRTVGINIRTGKRWRHGRKRVTRAGKVKLYPPVAAIPVISPRFLSEDERIVIADSVLAGRSVRDIARQLHRSPSTVCREVKRNRDPATGRYHPFRAHKALRDGSCGQPQGGRVYAARSSRLVMSSRKRGSVQDPERLGGLSRGSSRTESSGKPLKDAARGLAREDAGPRLAREPWSIEAFSRRRPQRHIEGRARPRCRREIGRIGESLPTLCTKVAASPPYRRKPLARLLPRARSSHRRTRSSVLGCGAGVHDEDRELPSAPSRPLGAERRGGGVEPLDDEGEAVSDGVGRRGVSIR